MWTFIIAFLIFGLALLAMAIGVVVRGRCLQGSCGGLRRLSGLGHRCAGCDRARGRARQRDSD